MTYRYRKSPCSECPWRRDQPPGRFPPARFEGLAASSYDMAMIQFACHKSVEGNDIACAGFLLRNADHNIGVRMQKAYRYDVVDGGHTLFDSFKEMAIANGVDPDDPVLSPCRSNGY